MTGGTPKSRRSFLLASSASAACSAISWAAEENSPAEILAIKVISQQDEYYHGWSTVARRANGDLFVVWSGRREEHVCPFGTVEIMHSRDEGESWTFPRTIHDGAIDDRDAGALETSKGTLFVTSFSSLAYDDHYLKKGKKTEDPRWLAAHQRIPDDEKRTAELGEWGFRSTDGGITWSNRIPTLVNSPHGPFELSDGRLLYAGKRLWEEEKRIGVCVSEDDGVSWKWISEIPTREGDNFSGYHELHAIECKDGSIIAQIRNHNTANKGETLQSRSTDGGMTWSTPESIGVWGLPSHLLRLRDGRILMSYGHRRSPFGNQARVSEDNGKTWSSPIIISGDGAGGDLGYPSTVELEDGTLLTVWYEKLDSSPRAVLRQAKWRLLG